MLENQEQQEYNKLTDNGTLIFPGITNVEGDLMANILVIEDDKEINRLLCSILVENKHGCFSEYSGKSACETLKSNKFDMVLLDLMLPGMSGEELLRDLRCFSNVPVIIISAKDATAVKVDMLR